MKSYSLVKYAHSHSSWRPLFSTLLVFLSLESQLFCRIFKLLGHELLLQSFIEY